MPKHRGAGHLYCVSRRLGIVTYDHLSGLDVLFARMSEQNTDISPVIGNTMSNLTPVGKRRARAIGAELNC